MKRAFSLLLSAIISLSVILPVQFNAASESPAIPSFTSFGTETELPGDWNIANANNIGTVYESQNATSAKLSDSLKDFGLDFKLKAPAGTVAPFAVLMRDTNGNSYEFAVNKTAGEGISFSGYTEATFADSSLNLADDNWHSVSVRLRAQRAVILVDGVKVMDHTLADEAAAGALSLNIGSANVYTSAINIYNVKAEDMDAVADYDFATDTYQKALPGVTWTYDTGDGTNGIQTINTWSNINVKSASNSAEVQSLANVTEFAMELKAYIKLSGGNEWQRGIQIKFSNGDYVWICRSVAHYYSGGVQTYNKTYDSIDSSLHTFDIVWSKDTLKVYLDKKTAPIFECGHAAASSAKPVVLNTAMQNTSALKIVSLKVKTGKGVHDLQIEKPAPVFTSEETDAYYTAFNVKNDLSGSLSSWNCENVGDAFRSTVAGDIVLNNGIENFGLDFKVLTPDEAIAPFAVLMRNADNRAYEFTVNKTDGSGINFSGYSEADFSDASLNISDRQWHSVSLKMRGSRMVVMIDGVKVIDRTLTDSATSGSILLKVNSADVYFSDINLYNVKTEDMDTLADYDFSTDTYQNALPGINWSYDANEKAITTADLENNANVKSASALDEVQDLAKVSEFAVEFKVKTEVVGDNTWQRGTQIVLPNGDKIQLLGSCYRSFFYGYPSDNEVRNDKSHSAFDTEWHVFDIVVTKETVKVYLDKQLAPVYERARLTDDTIGNVAFGTFMQTGSKVTLASLKLKTGSGVHDLEVERPAPEMTPADTAPYFDSFGTTTALSGNWASFDATNIGDAFRSAAADEIVLSDSTKNFGLDFKVCIPDEAINSFSVLMRKSDSAYELGVNRTDGSGVTFSGYNQTLLADSTLKIADGQWHNISVRMLDSRAVLLVDGVKVVDGALNGNSDGAVVLKINSADVNFSGIKIYSATVDSINTVAEYDFSTDSYSDIIPGINWAYDTSDDIKCIKTSDVENTGKIQSASKSEEVQQLARVTDFAMEIKMKIDITDPNAWQRGLSINLPNGHSFQMLNSIFRYDFCSDKTTQLAHDDFAKKWHTFDIIYTNGFLKIYLDKVRAPIYQLQTDAPGAAQIISLFSYLPNSNVQIKIASLNLRTGAGIHDPEFSPEIKATQSIIDLTSKEGWKPIENGIAATNESGYGHSYSGWGYNIAKAKDFIFDFTLKFKEDEKEAMSISLRYNLYNNHNEGYVLSFSSRKLVIAKYNDDNFQRTNIETFKIDFRKGVKVRIVAHDNELWIAFDGVRKFRLTDAMDKDGYIQVAHSPKMGEEGVTITDISLLYYNEETANNGITDETSSGPKIIADYSVTSQEEADAFFYGMFDYVNYAGKDAIKLSAQGKNRENTIHPTKIGDFVLTFYMNMDEASDINIFSLNLRKGYNDTRDFGFRVQFSKTSVQLFESKEGSHGANKFIAMGVTDMKGWVPIKIVAHGDTVAVFVNDELLILDKTAELAPGVITCSNNFLGADELYLSDILITEYYDGAIPAGATVKAPPARINKAKISNRKVALSAASSNNNTAPVISSDKSGSLILRIVLISLGAIILLAAVISGVFLIKKRRKKIVKQKT
ncbi:MAG: hypothetical protein M0P00_00695 [Bacteroidaceae bacterium]|nr:hypothetical protein [Bacteroidaceae bacterium]